jgi:hypothetical protein
MLVQGALAADHGARGDAVLAYNVVLRGLADRLELRRWSALDRQLVSCTSPDRSLFNAFRRHRRTCSSSQEFVALLHSRRPVDRARQWRNAFSLAAGFAFEALTSIT